MQMSSSQQPTSTSQKIAIIGAMTVETELLLSKLTVLETLKYAGFTYHLSRLGTLDLVITTCGVGKVNAASCTQILIDRFSPTAIINTGIAGAIKPGIKVLDVVMSDAVTYYDVRKAQLRGCYPYQEQFTPCESLSAAAAAATAGLEALGFNLHVGTIASGDAFIDNSADKARIQADYDAACVDMESCPIAHVSYINAVPFIVFRSISDQADEEATQSYEAFEDLAAHNSAAIVLKMLEHMA